MTPSALSNSRRKLGKNRKRRTQGRELHGQGPNAVRNRPFGLDASVLMDDALRLDKSLIHEWSFDLDKGEIAIVGKAKKSSRAGTIHLFLNWPNTDQNLPTGFVTISHPSWKTLPRYVLLTGIPNKDGGFLWRFLFWPLCGKRWT
jgi:hypothetical protein